MAESKRRDNDAVDGEINETDDLVVTDDASDAKPAEDKSDKAEKSSDKVKTEKSTEKRGNPFSRLGRFIREVVSELRKVIWPTRKELLTYTTVVVVFVAVMLTIVASLDWAFAKGVLWVFADGKK
ncbi:preprotein translocase subunit SecE [Longispora sp. NPDC051575]|uniref:preprotein translocase subunit SecE n=1 Tax=Longispora sp. NPDC051575 TaxID=3154943 RepID=UPI00342F1341